MDDKGSTMICIWGLAPLTHEDDATRAVITALDIKEKLKQIDVKSSFGIATGIVFSGVVGTSGGRKEFSVLGDVVNVAARIMGQSKKDGKIYIDYETKQDAESYLKFWYVNHYEFKGKSVSLPIYEPVPIEPKDLIYDPDALVWPNLTVDPKLILKLHSNPFLIDRDNKYQLKCNSMYGR